jgi:hypothetical protein
VDSVAFCPRCGARRPSGVRYCAGCGLDLGGSAPSTASEPGPATADVPETRTARPADKPDAPAAAPRAPAAPRRAGPLPQPTKRASAARSRRWRRLLLTGGVAAAVVLIAVVALVISGVLTSPAGSGPGGGSAAGDPFAARTLDPGAPRFPVPSGAELVNAYAEGSDAAAYRIALWTSAMPVDEIVAYYTDLHDQRWSLSGPPLTVMGVASLTFDDAQGTYDHASVDVSPGAATRIAARFVPGGAVAAPTAEIGSLGPPATTSPGAESQQPTLPPNQEVPTGFPDWANPPGGRLVDAGELNGLLLAVFDLDGREADVQEAVMTKLQEAGLSATATSVGGGTVLDVSGDHGQLILEPTDAGVRVSVAVRP